MNRIWRSKWTLGKNEKKYNDFTSEQDEDAQIKEREMGEACGKH